MAGFPTKGVYHIKIKCYTATVPEGQDALLAKHSDPHWWCLENVKTTGNMTLCTLKDQESECYLGVNSVTSHQPVCLVDEPQNWILRRTDFGFTISQVGKGGEYFWYLNKVNTPVVIQSKEIQSWVFEAPSSVPEGQNLVFEGGC